MNKIKILIIIGLFFGALVMPVVSFATSASEVRTRILRAIPEIMTSIRNIQSQIENMPVTNSTPVAPISDSSQATSLTPGGGETTQNNASTQVLEEYSNLSITTPVGSVIKAIFQGPDNLACVPYGGVLSIPFEWRRVERCSNNGSDIAVDRILKAQRGTHNNELFAMTYNLVNYGGKATGPFKVKLWLSADNVPGNTVQNIAGSDQETNSGTILNIPDKLLSEKIVELGANETKTIEFGNLIYRGIPVHSYHYRIIHLDAENQVAETNENNNVSLFGRIPTVR